jgi:LmbE family N-acetylglucosaminyl deacetylase
MLEERNLNNRMIVFAPHPDDATLGCGGTIAKRISEGFEVIIILMTDGRHAFSKEFSIWSDPTPEEVKQIRKEEFIRAIEMLGVPSKTLFFLDFEDGTLETHEKEAEERVIEVIRKYSFAHVYCPFVRDGHPDHKATNRIVRRAANRLGLSYLYEYIIIHTFARVGPLMERIVSFFKKNRIEIDVSGFLNLKKKALQEYKSEITIISSKQKKPLHSSLDQFLKSKEIFYTSG